MKISKKSSKNEADQHGLSQEDYKDLKSVFRHYPQIEKVILFGSRAMKTHKTGSDIDLALVAKGDDTFTLAATVRGELEDETSIPYFIDVLDLKNISSDELREHIRRHGVTIYERG